MTLSIQVSPHVEATLKERASAAGQPLDSYVAGLVEQAASRPTLDEILAPVRRDFAQSGMTEDELMALGRRELAALRADRKSGRS